MRTRMLLLFTVLCLLLCSCGNTDTADVYTMMPGVSFGMSVDAAKEIFPKHEETVEAILKPGETGEISRPTFSSISPPTVSPDFSPSVTMLLLRDINVLGNNANVTLTFMKMRDSFVDDKEYIHDLGLDAVYIEFTDTVDIDALLQNLADLFDIDDRREENNAIKLLSKLQIENLVSAELETLRSYMSEWPVKHTHSDEYITVDRSFFIESNGYSNGSIGNQDDFRKKLERIFGRAKDAPHPDRRKTQNFTPA